MKTAICYFSATGNGFEISSKLAKPLNGSLFYLPNTQVGDLVGFQRIVLVTPVYMFGLPVPTKEFIFSVKALRPRECHVILHYGGFSANAAHYTKAFFEKQGMSVCGIYKMKMPESYTIFSTVPQFYIRKTLKKSPKKIAAIGKNITDGKWQKARKNLFSFCDRLHDKTAEKWAELPNGFIITDNCTHCGYCESICPAKNITVSDTKPIFHGKCFACLACYQRCQNLAINYGKKTIGKRRYINPNVDFSQMK